jgi:hypothetical protein
MANGHSREELTKIIAQGEKELKRTDQDIRDLERQKVILQSWKSRQESYLNRIRQQRDDTKP